jgi:hypothetical protein
MSKAPVIWSHSSMASRGTPNWGMIGWKARQLTLDCARRIARKGGVVLLRFRRLHQRASSKPSRPVSMSNELHPEVQTL